LYRVNAFDWETEFAEIMKKVGGFDAVIGNPPYVLLSNADEKKYLQSVYKLSTGKPDLYRYFIERSHQIIAQNGRFCFIIPNTLLTIPASQKLREYLLSEGRVTQIVNFWGDVFSKVSVNSLIIFTVKGSSSNSVEIVEDKNEIPSMTTLNDAIRQKRLIEKSIWLGDEQVKFSLSSTKEMAALMGKIKTQSAPLSSVAKYTLGMQVYHNSIHSQQEMKERVYHSETKIDENFWRESTGRNVFRYHFVETFKHYVAYGERCYSKPSWEFCSEPRLLIREIPSQTLVCTITDIIHIPNKAVIIVIPHQINLCYLLGILNSRLIGFYVRASGEKGRQRLFPRLSLTTARQLPIRAIDFDNPTDKTNHNWQAIPQYRNATTLKVCA